MNLFERKVKGKPAVFVVEIKSSVPYPDEDTRKKKYSDPLSLIFSEFFGAVSIEYIKGENNKLVEINIACFEPTFSYKKSEEIEFYLVFFQKVSTLVRKFFVETGMKADIADIFLPSVSLVDYTVEHIKAKTEGKPFSEIIKKTWKPFPLPIAKYMTEIGPFFDTDICPDCGENLRGKPELHIAETDTKKFAKELLDVIKKTEPGKVWIDLADPITSRVKGTLVLRTKKAGYLFCMKLTKKI